MNFHQFENYSFDESRRELFRDGELVPLEPQICKVLHLLLVNAGEVVSRDTLLKEVWGGRSVSPSVIDNRIRAARRAVRDDGRTQRLIKTFMNEGYMFLGPVTTTASISEPSGTVDAVPSETTPAQFTKFGNEPSMLIIAALVMVLFVAAFWFGNNNSTRDRDPAVDAAVGITAPVLSKDTVAVLPFELGKTFARSEGDELHLAQSMIDILSSVPDLNVVSSISSFRFQSTDASPEEIAKALKSRYLISGSVVEEGGKTRLTIRMIEAESGVVHWAGSRYFDQDLPNSEGVISANLRSLVLSLLNALSISSDLPSGQLISAEAQRDYVRARSLLNSRSGPEILEAVALLEKVVAAEPDFVPALTNIVTAHHSAVLHAGKTNIEAARAIDIYVKQAREKAGLTPDILVALGLQALYRSKMRVALGYYDQALQIDPSHESAMLRRAEILDQMGDTTASGAAYEKALAYDPLSPLLLSRVARAKFSTGDVKSAFNHARDNLRWNENDVDALIDYGLFSRETGAYVKAFSSLQTALARNPTNVDAQFEMLLLLRSIGQIDKFEGFITSPSHRVLGYALMGDENLARAELKKDPLGSYGAYVDYIFGDSTSLYNYMDSTGWLTDLKTEAAQISTIRTFDAIFFADISIKSDDPDAKGILRNLERYFGADALRSIQLEEEHLALTGFHALQGDLTAAIEVINASTAKGLVFVGTLTRSPVFGSLRQHPRFPAALAHMQSEASSHWRAIEAITTQQK